MAPANFLPKGIPGPFLAVCPVFILLFIAGYGLAYQLSAERALSEARLSLAHLSYVLQVKDDMGLMDWSKSLEKTDDCLAYDVRAEGTQKLSGGNKTLLPNTFTGGLSFRLPSQWCFGWKPTGAAYEARIVFEAKPIPWFWGLAFGMGASLCYLGMLFYFRRLFAKEKTSFSSYPAPEDKAKTPHQVHAQVTSSPKVISYSRHPFLLVSKEQEILESSPSVSGIFSFFQPGATIFFDLEPVKELTDLIEKGEVGRVENAFQKAPGQGVTVKPAESGMLLVLEPSIAPSTPQKH